MNKLHKRIPLPLVVITDATTATSLQTKSEIEKYIIPNYF